MQGSIDTHPRCPPAGRRGAGCHGPASRIRDSLLNLPTAELSGLYGSSKIGLIQCKALAINARRLYIRVIV
jgi:hypothetical protein